MLRYKIKWNENCENGITLIYAMFWMSVFLQNSSVEILTLKVVELRG
jgi:hypothetical protein